MLRISAVDPIRRSKGQRVEPAATTLYGQRTVDALEREVAHRLDRHRVLHRYEHAGADQDLPRLCFVAQARGDVRTVPIAAYHRPAKVVRIECRSSFGCRPADHNGSGDSCNA
jgi:hypothetical protein